MRNKALKRLAAILITVSVLTAISSAQTPASASANTFPTTQAADDVCNQRLNKVLDALDRAEALIASLERVITAQDARDKAKDEVISSKTDQIKSRDERIETLSALKCDTTTLFFVWKK